MSLIVLITAALLALLGVTTLAADSDCCLAVVTIEMTNTTTLITPKTTVYELGNTSTGSGTGSSQISTALISVVTTDSLSHQNNLTSATPASINGTITQSETSTTTSTIILEAMGTISASSVSVINATAESLATTSFAENVTNGHIVVRPTWTGTWQNITANYSYEHTNTLLFQTSSDGNNDPATLVSSGSTTIVTSTAELTMTMQPTITCTIGHSCPENESPSASISTSTTMIQLSQSSVASLTIAPSSTSDTGALKTSMSILTTSTTILRTSTIITNLAGTSDTANSSSVSVTQTVSVLPAGTSSTTSASTTSGDVLPSFSGNSATSSAAAAQTSTAQNSTTAGDSAVSVTTTSMSSSTTSISDVSITTTSAISPSVVAITGNNATSTSRVPASETASVGGGGIEGRGGCLAMALLALSVALLL